MNYDRDTGQYSNSSDLITVEVPGFGETSTVEKLRGDSDTQAHFNHFNRDQASMLNYFNDFVNYFVRRGYERGKSIRAAPYDWRLGPGIIYIIS